MEDREMARMRKYGESKRLELWWQLYHTSLPVWDLENFRPMDFCWHEFTINQCTKYLGMKNVAIGEILYMDQ